MEEAASAGRPAYSRDLVGRRSGQERSGGGDPHAVGDRPVQEYSHSFTGRSDRSMLSSESKFSATEIGRMDPEGSRTAAVPGAAPDWFRSSDTPSSSLRSVETI